MYVLLCHRSKVPRFLIFLQITPFLPFKVKFPQILPASLHRLYDWEICLLFVWSTHTRDTVDIVILSAVDKARLDLILPHPLPAAPLHRLTASVPFRLEKTKLATDHKAQIHKARCKFHTRRSTLNKLLQQTRKNLVIQAPSKHPEKESFYCKWHKS